MAISIAIGCLHFDKRKGLMSLLDDMVRHDRQQRYKFIVNGTWTMFHDVINVDAIMGIGSRIKFLQSIHTSAYITSQASLPVHCGWRVHQLAVLHSH
jgi:hypothetical protein